MKLNNEEPYLMKKVFILLAINLFIFSCGKSGEDDKKLKELEYQLAKKEHELRQKENENQNPAAKTQTAVIIDKDGWTNVRNAPNMEGAIIDRIYEDEIFEVTPNLNENWWLVKTPNGIEGYMHKSKIKIADAFAVKTSDKAPPFLEGSVEYGVLSSKPIKFVFTKVKDNKIEGYNVLLNRKGFICEDVFGNDNLFANGNTTQRPFTGTYKAVEKYDNQEGYYYWEIEMSVNEPGTDEWDGKFEFTYVTSDLYGMGEGTWKSFNGKLTRELEICGPN